DTEDLTGVGLVADHHVVVEVDRALGKPRRARGIHPERGVVARRGRRLQPAGGLADQVLPALVLAGGPAGDEHVAQPGRLTERRAHFRQQRGRHDGDLGAAVAQEVDVVGGAQQRVGGDGDRPQLDGAPERPQELGGVQAAHPDAVLHADTQLTQRVARAVGEVLELGVGEDAALVVERGPRAAPLGHVAVDEPGRDVEVLRQAVGRDHRGLLVIVAMAAWLASPLLPCHCRRCSMKSVAVLLLIALVTFGLVGGAVAQTSSSPSGSASGSVSTPSGSASGTVSGPSSSSSSSEAKPSDSGSAATSTDRSSSSRTETKSDSSAVKSDSKSDGSALPRTVTTERTTIFGLSPTAAVIIAAALLV